MSHIQVVQEIGMTGMLRTGIGGRFIQYFAHCAFTVKETDGIWFIHVDTKPFTNCHGLTQACPSNILITMFYIVLALCWLLCSIAVALTCMVIS